MNEQPTREKLPWYRRNYVVDPKVQLKIVALLGGIALISSATICIVTYERVSHMGSLFSFIPGGVGLEVTAKTVAASLMLRLIAVVVVMSFTFVAAGIMLTHRLAGPIYKIQDVTQRFLDGEKVAPLVFRKNDEFKELADLVNRLMQGYKR